MARQTHEVSTSLRDLYPEFDDEAIASAIEALDRYIDLAARITGRIVNDSESLAEHRSLTQDAESMDGRERIA